MKSVIKKHSASSYVVFDFGEEDIPDDCDNVDVENSIGLRNPHEVDVLRRGPNAPVKL